MIFISVGCNRQSPAGAPFDAVATLGPQLKAEIYLYDTQPDNTTKTAANVQIQLVSPGNVTETGMTDANGYVRLVIYGYGNHRLIIPNDTAHGYTTPLEYSLNAVSDDTVKTIVRSTQLISMSLDPIYVNAFGSVSTSIKYDVSYKADVSKMYTLSVKGLPTGATWQFIPPYVQNNGDTSVLTITTPKYLRIGTMGTSITFTAGGDDGDGMGASFPVGDTVSGYALYQNWAFDIANVSVNNTLRVVYTTNTSASASLGGSFQLTNLTNFPSQYPLSVNIVQGSPTYMSGGVVYDLINYCSNKAVNIYVSDAGNNATTYLTKISLYNIYNDFVTNNGKLYIDLMTSGCNLTSNSWTWVHMQVEFTNIDGFDYVLNCGTDY
jgi:hypothetical protein